MIMFTNLCFKHSNDDCIIIIIILFIERHIQQAVRGALQHSIAALSVIINIQVNYF